MPPDQKSFTDEIVRTIQDIVSNPALTAKQKKQAIDSLKGATKEDMYDYMNKNFRIDSELLQITISAGKQKGMPKDSIDSSKKSK